VKRNKTILQHSGPA